MAFDRNKSIGADYRWDVMMALNELAALEAAYHALQPLDGGARRRALQWLSAALSDGIRPAETSAEQAMPPSRVIAATKSKQAPASGRAAATRSGSAQAKNRKLAAQAKSSRRRGAAKQDASAGGAHRVYRRMPEAGVVMEAYRQTGTVTGLAEHFDVPLHTVNHWARQLRKQGYPIGRSQ